MNRRINKLSKYIDTLNEERKPKEHENKKESPEMEELFETVRQVRSLKDPKLPEEDYAEKLTTVVKSGQSKKKTKRTSKRTRYVGLAAVAAVLVFIIVLNTVGPFARPNIVQAMEQAFLQIGAYHGIVEVIETNAEGESVTQTKVEVWADKEGRYYVKGIEGWQKDLVTANDGETKWQIRHDDKEVKLFSAFPDPYGFTFEIGQEIEDAKKAEKVEILGDDVIAGRKTYIMEVTPKGGAPYKIWIDKETKMPLQKQSAMEYALQYTKRYTEIEFIDSIPKELMTLRIPEGYIKTENNPEYIVTGFEEAKELAGFVPKIPKQLPESFIQRSIAVLIKDGILKINYASSDNTDKITVLQKEADEMFKPSSMAILGKVNGNAAEIQSPIQNTVGILQGGGVYASTTGIRSIRWQQEGMEYAVYGNVSLDVLARFVEALSDGPVEIPKPEEPLPQEPNPEEAQDEPTIKVPVDLEVEKGDQKNVDAGHSPWKLDPVFVAQVFVSLQMSPEGIQGDYPIDYEDFTMVKNDGVKAIVETDNSESPVKRVYLERLVRQDETGIWTVVGYDPKEDA
jgi:outer membrane lipoprotein-sorting protein